jgi:hypothetical protein
MIVSMPPVSRYLRGLRERHPHATAADRPPGSAGYVGADPEMATLTVDAWRSVARMTQ